MTARTCPVCGADMTNVDPQAHADYHFNPRTEPVVFSQQAREHRQQILNGGVEAAGDSSTIPVA